MNQKYIIEELAKIDEGLDKIMRMTKRKYFVQDTVMDIRQHCNNLRREMINRTETIGRELS